MNALVIVAGGTGLRFGGSLPKQYLELAGKPILIRTLEAFLDFDPAMHLVLVLAREHLPFWETMEKLVPAGNPLHITFGGKERFDSVMNGLKLVKDGHIVGIHDAVRPLVSRETIERCYAVAADSGSAIPVIAMEDSVRMLGEGKSSENLERARLRRVQTPQTFQAGQIKQAYARAGRKGFTDDASVYENHFGSVSLVEGNPENIKITTATDLQLASLLV